MKNSFQIALHMSIDRPFLAELRPSVSAQSKQIFWNCQIKFSVL